MNQDFVVVACRKDLPLLEMLFKSIQLYAGDIFKHYWIINNDDLSIDEFPSINKPHTIVNLKRLSCDDYINQQIAKLTISGHITSEWYWVFDSKNFLIKSITHDDLYENNKPRVSLETYRDPYWYTGWVFLSEMYALPEQMPIRNNTPYPIHTVTAKELIESVDYFPSKFLEWYSSHNVCEFFLYYAFYLSKHDAFDLYSSQPFSTIANRPIWPGELSGNTPLLLKKNDIWCTGLHRDTLKTMDVKHRILWTEFLKECGIIDQFAALPFQ